MFDVRRGMMDPVKVWASDVPSESTERLFSPPVTVRMLDRVLSTFITTSETDHKDQLWYIYSDFITAAEAHFHTLFLSSFITK